MAYKARVIAAYQSASPDPLMAKTEEELKIGGRDADWPGWIHCTDNRGKSGWVPDAYLDVNGKSGRMKVDYWAGELSVDVGDELTVEKEESGWVWCVNTAGVKGWIPSKQIGKA
jgi:uncharacterized protein YgiM (DUF1202 family)